MRRYTRIGWFALALGAWAVFVQGLPAQEAELPTAPLPTAIPKTARLAKNPVPPTEESLKIGRRVFASQCAMCHGPEGDGKGALVERLGLQVPDFTRPGYGATRTDGDLFYILTHGHEKMPGEGDRLSDETKWHLVNAVRALSPDR